MTESERDRLRRLVHELADYAAWNDKSGIGALASLDKIGEGLTALLNSPAAPSTTGFALVGPDGQIIPETIGHTIDRVGILAMGWSFDRMDIPPSATVERLAAHGYHIRPVEIIVKPEEPKL